MRFEERSSDGSMTAFQEACRPRHLRRVSRRARHLEPELAAGTQRDRIRHDRPLRARGTNKDGAAGGGANRPPTASLAGRALLGRRRPPRPSTGRGRWETTCAAARVPPRGSAPSTHERRCDRPIQWTSTVRTPAGKARATRKPLNVSTFRGSTPPRSAARHVLAFVYQKWIGLKRTSWLKMRPCGLLSHRRVGGSRCSASGSRPHARAEMVGARRPRRRSPGDSTSPRFCRRVRSWSSGGTTTPTP